MVRSIAITGFLLSLTSLSSGSILLDSMSSEWTPIIYPGVTSDFASDEQAKSVESDIVGTDSFPGIYLRFDDGGTDRVTNNQDGQLAFRIRLAGEQNPPGYTAVLWIGLAIQGVGDAGGATDLDVFLGYDSGTGTIGVHGAGTGANTSPNTTTIDFNNTAIGYTIPADSSNLFWAPVNTIDTGVSGSDLNLDGGTAGGRNNTDHFLTVAFPMDLIVNAVSGLTGGVFTDETPFGAVVATATQTNSLNQDLNGVEGDTNSSISWDDLDAISPLMDSTGTIVPEPGQTIAFLGLIAFGFVFVRRRALR